MSILKHIKLECCECGATPTEEAIDTWSAESRKFSCGRWIILRGGNPSNYTLENYRDCPKSEKSKLKMLGVTKLLEELLAVCKANTVVDKAVLADVECNIRNSLCWRLR